MSDREARSRSGARADDIGAQAARHAPAAAANVKLRLLRFIT
jgi:hypothetical protein